MKRIALGVACFGVLCTLAYYSSRLYSDSYYDDRLWSLETETPGEEETPVQTGNGEDVRGEGTAETEESGYVAGGTGPKSPAGVTVERDTLAEQGGRPGEELRETSLPSDHIQTELPLGEEPGISQYYLVEEFGYVNIYKEDMETIYEYTEIHIRDLPQELQEEICLGKWLYSEEELYDFLENYSS